MLETLIETTLLFAEHMLALPLFVLSPKFRHKTLQKYRRWRQTPMGTLGILLDVLFHLVLFAGGCLLILLAALWLLDSQP